MNRRRPGGRQPATPRHDGTPGDTSWLDEPIRRGRRLNPGLDWLWDQIPARAQALILKAARGEVRARGEPLPPAETLAAHLASQDNSCCSRRAEGGGEVVRQPGGGDLCAAGASLAVPAADAAGSRRAALRRAVGGGGSWGWAAAGVGAPAAPPKTGIVMPTRTRSPTAPASSTGLKDPHLARRQSGRLPWRRAGRSRCAHRPARRPQPGRTPR